MFYRFSMGVIGIHGLLLSIRTTTSHFQQVIDDSEINENWRFVWLLARYFFSSFLTLKNQGFPKFSQNLKAGDLAISVVYLQMLDPDWQAAAPSSIQRYSRHLSQARPTTDVQARTWFAARALLDTLSCPLLFSVRISWAGAARSGYSLSCHLILTEKYEEYKSFSKFQMTVDLCLKTKEDKTHCMTKWHTLCRMIHLDCKT